MTLSFDLDLYMVKTN